MSRLTDLIARARAKDAALGEELEKEFKALSSRRAFGLNFERHKPESVEMPGQPVRKGDKVRILPERGSTKKGDQTLWKVLKISKKEDVRFAELEQLDVEDPQTSEAAVDDLVVVAEFRDYIYPGLVSTGKVERGGDKPYQTVINGENFHALEALTYTHRGMFDLIYIDPPYNSGAKDWKYNNNYVEVDDLYRHSKWLAFIERRLLVARELLNPKDSVLIVSIDEKEYLRLGLLLEQTFPEAKIEMISTVINNKGTGRSGDFARTNEYIYFVRFGDCKVGTKEDENSLGEQVSWETMRRRNLASVRGRKGKGACGPNQFYPIYVNEASGSIVGRGEPLSVDVDIKTVGAPNGCIPVFPIRKDGTEMNWEYTADAFDNWFEKGYIRANGRKNEPQAYIIQHLPNKARNEIEDGIAVILDRREDGSVVAQYQQSSSKAVKTQWDYTSHSAEHGGTGVLKALIPSRVFPYPKSLFAVEDCLSIFLDKKPNALVLDFFAGSGTTAHAVMRLNKKDGGERQSICITNNEVSAEEQSQLRARGFRPGDEEWERFGICNYLTKPRIKAAITGLTPDGKKITQSYKYNDEFPMADGFKENAEFFTLTYETPVAVRHNIAFKRISPLLWMRAGSKGSRVEKIPDQGWDVVEAYGVLVNLDQSTKFCKAIRSRESVCIAYIVTDDDRRFQAVARHLPDSVEIVRLYESYLSNFRFSIGR